MAILVEHPFGGIVAFEGHADLISTQLRLLPTSPYLLILPSIQNYITPAAINPQDDGRHHIFDARAYIRQVHDAARLRRETAMAFLETSSSTTAVPSSKRLVFLNGGTPSAYALCIRTIAARETDGNLDLAETTFGHLIRSGLRGLAVMPHELGHGLGLGAAYDDLHDPSARAMKAADILDRLTAGLQPMDSMALDLTNPRAPRPRSASLPLYGFADRFGDAVPFYVFGAAEDAAVDQPSEEESEKKDPERVWQGPKTARMAADRIPRLPWIIEDKSLGGIAKTTADQLSVSCVGEPYPEGRQRSASFQSSIGSPVPSPMSDIFDLPPLNQHIICGKASLVELRPGRVMRTLSLDRLVPCPSAAAQETSKSRIATTAKSPKFPTFQDTCTPRDRHFPRLDVSSSALGIWTSAPVPKSPTRRLGRLDYVDRGTDAAGDDGTDTVIFQPVLPFFEDLVVYFEHSTLDPLLHKITGSFQIGRLPVSPNSVAFSDGGDSVDGMQHNSPRSLMAGCLDGPTSATRIAQSDHGPDAAESLVADTDESDDVCAHNSAPPSWVPRFKRNKAARQPPKSPKNSPPASPYGSPRPTPAHANNRFHNLALTGSPTAIQIQNELRSILNTYFPSSSSSSSSSSGNAAGAYHQFMFPLPVAGLGDLWSPIFCETEPSTPGSASIRSASSRKHHRHVDLILAVGLHGNVKKQFFAGIVSRLAGLGTKCNGETRSGKLDFR